jgi:integrase
MSHLFLTEEKIHILLESAKANLRDYALLHMAASTALRGSDLLRITLEDMVDRNGEIIRLLRLKMKKTAQWIERPLRDDCRQAVFTWINSRRDKNPYLFICLGNEGKNRKKPLSRMGYDRIIKKYLALQYHESVLQGCSTHTLRRSVAKLVYKKTGEIAAAQSLLGHHSPINTIKYIDPNEIKEKANKVVLEDLQW